MLTGDHQSAVRSALLHAGTGESHVGLAEWSARVCRVAVTMLSASGAAVTATAAGTDPAGRLVAASDFCTRGLEDAQVTARQGPCIDAAGHGQPVLAADLAEDGSTRWPAFTALARARGVAGVFAYPLQVGAARLGVLSVYRGRPGVWTRDERWIVAALAAAATDGLVYGGDHGLDMHGPRDLAGGFAAQQALYQAQGMVMVDLQVSITEAVARLRQHAHEQHGRVSDVAVEIVAGRLRLAPPQSTPRTGLDTQTPPDA